MEALIDTLKTGLTALATQAAPLGEEVARDIGERAADELYDLVESTKTKLDDAAVDHGAVPLVDGFKARLEERKTAAEAA